MVDVGTEGEPLVGANQLAFRTRLLVADPCLSTGRGSSYADEESRDGSQHSQRKGQRDDLGGAAGVRAEDVVNLGLFAIAEGLLVLWGRRVRIGLDLDIENRRDEALCGAEGGNNDRSLEGLGREEELDRDLLLGLSRVVLG